MLEHRNSLPTGPSNSQKPLSAGRGEIIAPADENADGREGLFCGPEEAKETSKLISRMSFIFSPPLPQPV